MEKLTAISNSRILRRQVKRELLLFETIAVTNPEYVRTTIIDPQCNSRDWLIAEYEWLRENGLVIDAVFPDKWVPGNAEIDQLMTKLLAESRATEAPDLIGRSLNELRINPLAVEHGANEIGVNATLVRDVISRIATCYMRDVQGIPTCAITEQAYYTSPSPSDKNTVLNIVLRTLPVVSEETPWEAILEFRSDEDSWLRFLMLRNWITEIAAKAMKPNEIEEKLEYLIHEYETQMKRHRLKYNTGLLETTVVTFAEVAEDLVKFKWGKMAKTLFQLRKHHTLLLDAEAGTPGREISYIVKAHERFKGEQA